MIVVLESEKRGGRGFSAFDLRIVYIGNTYAIDILIIRVLPIMLLLKIYYILLLDKHYTLLSNTEHTSTT